MAEPRHQDAWIWALAALSAAGAALRFSTLRVQSFWLDEAVTHGLVTRPLGSMLAMIPHSESTPPLYYLAAWIWVRIFGAGEAGLRSLSALFGTATIVLLALIARRLAGNRAGLAAAALCATNPLLIWYSQEARAYALLVALCALSLWCLLRNDWRGWAIAAALALATHYFAVFIVVPELAWLGRRHARGPGAVPADDSDVHPAIENQERQGHPEERHQRRSRWAPAPLPRMPASDTTRGTGGLQRRGRGPIPSGDRKVAAWSAGFVVAVAAALAPLAIAQAAGNRAAFISTRALAGRIAAVPKQFLIGYATPHAVVLTILAAGLAIGLALRLRRSDRVLVALATVAVGVPVLLALLGADYLITRNVIAAMVPLVVLAGILATRSRAGPALICGLCAIGIVAFAGVEASAFYQRDDWRALAAALGPATHGPRVVDVNPSDGPPALEIYTPLHRLPAGQPVVTREIDVIDLQHDPPHIAAPAPVPGFALCAPPVQSAEFDVVRYCAPTPVTVSYAVVVSLRLVVPEPSVLGGR